jgi:hypothetical protein
MSPRPALALSAAIVASAALALSGCSSPTPTTGDGGDDPVDTPVSIEQPAWYGDDRGDDDCPVPQDGSKIEAADIDEFLQVGAPDNWCTYKSTEYTQYYAIPVEKGTDFGAEVRNVLEPVGWQFDAPDDDSPQWSWITAYPDGAEADFTDGAVDGAILTVASATEDDFSYKMWFSALPTAFGSDWEAGDEITIVGLW